MTTTQHSVPLKGREVQFVSSCETLADAYHVVAAAVLAGKVKSSKFVESLLLAARQRRLSLRQVGWIHFIATETLNPAAVAHARAVPELNLLPIVEMMAKAAGAQKRRPRITLLHEGAKVVLSQCGSKSRTPGCVAVSDGSFGGSYYGLIQLDGSVTTGRNWGALVESLLRQLAADPARVAGQHGVATGNCCFCAKELTTKESRSVGYGPICAEKFGLPWGEVSPAVEAANTQAQAF